MSISKKSNKKEKIINRELKTPYVPSGKRGKRPDYMDKKSFFSISGDTFGIIIAVFVSFFGTYFFLPGHGILSSIPVVIICAFICSFVKISHIFKMMFFFISPFAVSILLGRKVISALVLSLVCVVLYILCYLCVKLFLKKDFIYKAVSVLLLVASLGVHIWSNDLPWNFSRNNNQLKSYVISNYANEPISASDVEFDLFNRTYFTTLTLKAGIDLDVVMKDGVVIKDEYVDYAEKVNMLIGAGQITYVIRKLYPDMKFSVESDRIYGYPFSSSASVIIKNDYSRYMDFSVYFPSYHGAKEFASIAEECYRELLKSGFCCRNITFYGGIGTKYVAKIQVPFNALTKDLKTFVSPYFEKGFVYTCLK